MEIQQLFSTEQIEKQTKLNIFDNKPKFFNATNSDIKFGSELIGAVIGFVVGFFVLSTIYSVIIKKDK